MLYPEKKEESTPFDFLTIQYSDRAVHIRCDAAISAAGNRQPAVLSRAIGQWMARIHRHTEVIDCGESGIDGDRWIWDGIAPLKEILYWILGDRA